MWIAKLATKVKLQSGKIVPLEGGEPLPLDADVSPNFYLWFRWTGKDKPIRDFAEYVKYMRGNKPAKKKPPVVVERIDEIIEIDSELGEALVEVDTKSAVDEKPLRLSIPRKV